MDPIRVFLVDDHKAFVDSMRLALPAHSNETVQVVGAAFSVDEALQMIAAEQTGIDVVVTDFQLPPTNGIELGIRVKALNTPLKVMLLTMFDALEVVMKADRNHLDGFAPKSCSISEIIATIVEVHNGTFEFDYVNTNNRKPRISNNPVLTKSELQVLSYIVKNEYSNADIARLMNKSIHTIDSHRRNIGQKLGVHSVVGFVKYAYAIGML